MDASENGQNIEYRKLKQRQLSIDSYSIKIKTIACVAAVKKKIPGNLPSV